MVAPKTLRKFDTKTFLSTIDGGEPSAPDSELNPGDRVEGLADFGKPTGEFGTVEQTNEDDALVKWDNDGRMRLRQPWLKKVSNRVHALGKPASA